MALRLSICFFTLCLLTLISSYSYGTQLFLVNNCSESIWPGILAHQGYATPNNGGFHLSRAQQVLIETPQHWSGRIWGRRGCSFDNNGVGSCQTGDCGGRLECRGAGGEPPATLVQMTLGTLQNPVHYYDVSLVDGFNLPISMVPVDYPCGGDHSCGTAACEEDLNAACPAYLAIQQDNKVLGCQSDCLATKAPEYCCTSVYSNTQNCKPSIAARVFKALCPRAYSYAYDDSTSLNKCRALRYVLTFCPSKA
ncbi:OLC1v1027755C1 [Oldenlandia corymbosa var. corymbosa]|uniref:OLC1v1027755C1 n=1 Tax=Oldenlandia corymbosa var. corymbosa TaxID=529605 RepID=A0AAV1CA57_OLDCO|nr:OLC1v1027755C1 [Oldenlandia corymbosa var. corymbosa]